MIYESADLIPFWEWLPSALLFWLLVVVVASFVGALAGWLFTTLRHGPIIGLSVLLQTFATGVVDLVLISPRRLWALTKLTFKESIRRRVIIVFFLFMIVLLFAGWFLDPSSDAPARLYLSFVLWGTCVFTLVLMLFLSVLSIPADIRSHTIQTVVTKPVRASEIVLGRILGFTAIGTVLLALMGTVSYVFVLRGLSHVHDLTPADVEKAEKAWAKAIANKAPLTPQTLRTTLVNGHRHLVTIDPSARTPGVKASGVKPPGAAEPDAKATAGAPGRGKAKTAAAQDHWHDLSYEIVSQADGQPCQLQAQLGGPRGMLVARVPTYGTLAFKDRSGNDSEKGISVGDEWKYRSYVQGGTLAAAVWTFDGITEDRFPNGLPLELNIGVFRTTKGDIEKGVPGSLVVRNPKTGMKSDAKIFASEEYVTMQHFIPRKLRAGDRELDLYSDLVADGKVEIWLQCVAHQQYFGAGLIDCYLRPRDASFAFNFFKAYLGIWMQMVLVAVIGVMFSTFLSGPIAMLATGGALVYGIFSQSVKEVAQHKFIGGGPLEMLYRLFTQENLVQEMPTGFQKTILQGLDRVLEKPMLAVWAVLPDFGQFNFSDPIVKGFDISAGDPIQKCLFRVVGFLIPVFIAGYFFLKTREVAQ